MKNPTPENEQNRFSSILQQLWIAFWILHFNKCLHFEKKVPYFDSSVLGSSNQFRFIELQASNFVFMGVYLFKKKQRDFVKIKQKVKLSIIRIESFFWWDFHLKLKNESCTVLMHLQVFMSQIFTVRSKDPVTILFSSNCSAVIQPGGKWPEHMFLNKNNTSKYYRSDEFQEWKWRCYFCVLWIFSPFVLYASPTFWLLSLHHSQCTSHSFLLTL
jgi:hypothetical protein